MSFFENTAARGLWRENYGRQMNVGHSLWLDGDFVF